MSDTISACSNSIKQSTSSALNSISKTMSKEHQELQQHPLFNLAIVNKVQQKIPLMNKFVLLIGERYSKLKSGYGFIGNTMDQMEQQLFSIAANVVQLVPKQPVVMVDQVVCQGLDLIQNQVVSLAQSTKEVKDRILDAPQILVGKVSQLNNSDPVYTSLDLALTILERTMDRYWPVENDQFKNNIENSTEINGIKSSGEGVLYHIIPLGRLIKRIRQFFHHTRIHLMDLAKNNKLFGRVTIILNTFLVQSPSIPLKPSDSCKLPPTTDVVPPIKDETMNNINGPPYIVEIGKLAKEKTPEKLNGDLPINKIDVSNVIKAEKSPLSNGNNHLQLQQIQPQNNQLSAENVAATVQKLQSESDSIYEQQVMDIVNRIVNKDEQENEPKPWEQDLSGIVPENNPEQSEQVDVQPVEQLPTQDGSKEHKINRKNKSNKKN